MEGSRFPTVGEIRVLPPYDQNLESLEGRGYNLFLPLIKLSTSISYTFILTTPWTKGICNSF